MTPSKRNSESILLKERKSLISSGANPKDIKGKSNKLLLNGSVYGSVQGSSFSLNVQNSIQVSSDSHVGTRCGPRREGEQRRRLWPGSALYLPRVRPTCLCLPNERTS